MSRIHVLGFGFREKATPAALLEAAEKAVRAAGLAGGLAAITHIASVRRKAESQLFKEVAARLDAAIIPIEAIDLADIDTPTQSANVQAIFKTGSLAEAAALAALAQAELAAPRSQSDDSLATAALATGHALQDKETIS